MTTINPPGIGATPAAPSGPAASLLGNAAEQKDMFLKLLVAQLKNQDPSSPMDQKDMMAQMAQFTSVEQMANMVKTLDTLSFNSAVGQSVGLIGRPIDYTTGTDISSAVESSVVKGVSTVGGKITLTLENGQSIEPHTVIRVTG